MGNDSRHPAYNCGGSVFEAPIRPGQALGRWPTAVLRLPGKVNLPREK